MSDEDADIQEFKMIYRELAGRRAGWAAVWLRLLSLIIGRVKHQA